MTAPIGITPRSSAPPSDLTGVVREKYGAAARRVLEVNETASCCGPTSSCCGGTEFNGSVDPITSNLYVNGETSELPDAAVLASLGCWGLAADVLACIVSLSARSKVRWGC